MSYQTQAQLRDESMNFQPRCRTAMVEHALTFRPHVTPYSLDGDTAEQALARVIIKGGVGVAEELTFFSLVAATPGFADKADDGEGGVDASRITDQELLDAVQDNWALVAGLWYNADGTPIT